MPRLLLSQWVWWGFSGGLGKTTACFEAAFLVLRIGKFTTLRRSSIVQGNATLLLYAFVTVGNVLGRGADAFDRGVNDGN